MNKKQPIGVSLIAAFSFLVAGILFLYQISVSAEAAARGIQSNLLLSLSTWVSLVLLVGSIGLFLRKTWARVFLLFLISLSVLMVSASTIMSLLRGVLSINEIILLVILLWSAFYLTRKEVIGQFRP